MDSSPMGERPPGLGAAYFWGRRAHLRASDSDREAVVTALSEHHVAGRLTADELSERTHQALMARTLGELQRITNDLPTQLVPQPMARLFPGSRRPPLAPGMEYGGFWARAGAFCFDYLGGNLAAYLLLNPVLPHHLFVVVDPLYFIVCWSTTGATAGMAFLGLRVVREEDRGRLGIGRSVVRSLGFLVDLMSCFVGFAWAGVDPRKQAWHDKMAGSIVVRKVRRGRG